jgi:hypothetical protein
MSIRMKTVLSQLPLSIQPNEYEAMLVGGLGRSGEGDVADHKQADRMTSGGALSVPLHIWKDESSA